MRLGDLDELKKEFDIIASNSAIGNWQTIPIKHIIQIIDNAPTVEVDKEFIDKIRATGNFKNGYQLAKNYYKRPQGKCKTCKHRDPEDKKCDCGGLERQGCPFPVSDDYYCKYYERGEEE